MLIVWNMKQTTTLLFHQLERNIIQLPHQVVLTLKKILLAHLLITTQDYPQNLQINFTTCIVLKNS